MKALIVVDVQNDFTHPDGSLYIANSDFVIDQINKLLPHYENVVYTMDWHPPRTDHFEEWPPHCVAGTWGAEFNERLDVLVQPQLIKKGIHADEDGYSGFSVDTPQGIAPTPLQDKLISAGVGAVDIVGIALDVCVKATALDAQRLGYYTTVIRYATAPVTDEGGLAAVDELRSAGVTI